MKATDLLERQHKEVKTLFKKIENAGNREKAQLFEQLATNLVAHDVIERELFYPACEEAMGMTDILGESLVEHGTAEFGLYQADRALGDDDFDYKVTVLKELIVHHADEEEKELFPKVKKAIGSEELEELGVQMEQRFAEVKEQGDYRSILHESLSQVLAGAIKTRAKSAPPKSKSGNGARTNGSRGASTRSKSAASQSRSRSGSSSSRSKNGASARAHR